METSKEIIIVAKRCEEILDPLSAAQQQAVLQRLVEHYQIVLPTGVEPGTGFKPGETIYDVIEQFNEQVAKDKKTN